MENTVASTRIAFCITDLDPGGAERALVQLVTRLDRSRWEPAVFCLAGSGALVDVLRAAAVPVVCLNARHRVDVFVVRRLRRELCRFNPRIVQTFLFHANLAGRFAAPRLPGCDPLVVSGIRVADRRSRWRLWLDRQTNHRVAANVCVSQAVAEFSADIGGLPREKLTVIPNGVDVATFAQAEPLDWTTLGIPRESRVIAAVGRLDRQKGLSYLVDAAAGVVARHPEVHIVLVGEGPERAAIERQTATLGLVGRVHLAGWRSDIPNVLRAAYALVLPSLWEGMPNVVLEAMAAGLPVLATRVEGVEELVVPEETGLIVAPACRDEISSGLEALLADPARAHALGQTGQERAKAAFSWENMAREYESLYERLLAAPRRGTLTDR